MAAASTPDALPNRPDLPEANGPDVFGEAVGEVDLSVKVAPRQEGVMARWLPRKRKDIPVYPVSARIKGQEGWVQLSFVVSPEGRVSDPIVEDSSGLEVFEKAALEKVVSYRYSPATWNGKPVEQCATRIKFSFLMSGNKMGARRSFITSYGKIQEAGSAGDLATANALIAQVQADGTWTIYEQAHLSLLQASLLNSSGQNAEALQSLRRATVYDGTYLEGKHYKSALIHRFRLEVKLGLFADAFDTYAEMQKARPPITDPEVEKAMAEMHALIDGPHPLGIDGEIGYRTGCDVGKPNWQHRLIRRSFSFSKAEGKLDDFEIRCDWKRIVSEFSTELEWHIPDDYGACQVFVFGEPGATVRLVEYPAPAAAAPE